MGKKISIILANIFYSKNWIDDNQKEWFCYHIELIINFVIFLASVFFYSVLFNCLFETVLFLVPMIQLRKFSGGWHANTPLQCFFISMILVYLVTQLFGPLITRFSLPLIFLLILIISILLYLEPPSYPRQLHFDPYIIEKNSQKKQQTIFILLILQISFGLMSVKSILVYTYLAEVVCLLSIIQERRKKNENV